MADYAKDVLVDTDWVAEHLDDDSIRIVEVDENPALYAEAHIPGAIGFDWKADLQDQVKRDFLSPEDFGRLMGWRGISNDHTVVLYGDRNNWFAAYTYWYFLYYGHDKVKLVNGPREKWISEGRDTTTEVPSYPAATFEAKPGDESIRARREEVLEALDSETSLVDVRSPQEYSGELIAMAGYEQEGAQRSGHIPGADLGALGPGGERGRDLQVRRRAARALHVQGRDRRRNAGDRLLPDRRALGAHLVRAPRAARAWTTSRTTTARGPSGATWSTSRSRRTSSARVASTPSIRSSSSARIRAVAPQIRCSPDHVGGSADRHPASDQAPHREAAAQLVEPEEQHGGDLVGIRLEAQALGDQADERVDLVAGDEGPDRGERADHLDVGRVEADLLVGLAQRRSRPGPPRASPGGRPGNEISPAVATQVAPPLGEHQPGASPDGRTSPASTAASVPPGACIVPGFLGGQQGAAQRAGELIHSAQYRARR